MISFKDLRNNPQSVFKMCDGLSSCLPLHAGSLDVLAMLLHQYLNEINASRVLVACLDLIAKIWGVVMAKLCSKNMVKGLTVKAQPNVKTTMNNKKVFLSKLSHHRLRSISRVGKSLMRCQESARGGVHCQPSHNASITRATSI
jgi:hypothetical protein